MKINKLSFITPIEKIADKKIVLQKSYTLDYQLPKGISLSIASNIGNRDSQQDCIAITSNGKYTLLLVSDGIGGMEEGEQASYSTAKIIKKWLETEEKEVLKKLNEKTLEDILNALMYLISTNIPKLSGATLNMSIICPDKTLIVNIGDSRTYTIKNGKITLRTKDDSLVFKKFNPQTETDRNRLRFHKDNNILTNSITRDAFPTIRITSIKNEDYDIICHVTDGVTDFLPEHLISSYSKLSNPASVLVRKSTKGIPIYNYTDDKELKKCIEPGEDNATAIVYTKKLTKNN